MLTRTCLMFALLALSACSAKLETSGGGGGGGIPLPLIPNGGDQKPSVGTPATGIENAHSVYCSNDRFEVVIDLKDKTFQEGLYPSKVTVALREKADPAIMFGLIGIQSISKADFNGETTYSMVSSNRYDNQYWVFSFNTANYVSGKMEYTNWSNSFTYELNCSGLQTNPFRGTPNWPNNN